jgi:hypothetical protein
MTRGGKIAAGIGGAIAALLVLVLVGLLIVTETRWGREQVRRIALEQLDAAIDGQVRIGSVELGLESRFRLVDIAISDPEGRPFVVADTLATGFSLLGLLRQRVELTDVRLVNATVMLDRRPGEDWNFVRIFRIDPEPRPEPLRPGWGDFIVLRDVRLVQTYVEVRTAWHPEEGLAPAEQERAIAEALAGETRARVRQVPEGLQNVMRFRLADATVPRARVAHPDFDVMLFEVASLRGLLEPFLPPAAEVHDLDGRVTISSDSLYFENVAAVLPASRITGAGVLEDLADFFQSFEGMYGGFKDRAASVYRLLQGPATAFVVVATPEPPALREARFFLQRLTQDGMPTAGLVVNRITPLPSGAAAELDHRAARAAPQQRNDPSPERRAAAALLRLHADRIEAARRDRHNVTAALHGVDPRVLVEVPLMSSDVHDLEGLDAIGEWLYAHG